MLVSSYLRDFDSKPIRCYEIYIPILTETVVSPSYVIHRAFR